MGQWLARVRFPDGQVRYATYSTVVEALLAGLYDDFSGEGETDALGQPVHRAKVAGEPAPADPSAPVSEPDWIIPVRIEVEPDGMTWTALYCPQRNQIVGPHSGFTADRVQETFNLVRQGDRLHLVHVWAAAGAPPARRHWLKRRRDADAAPDRSALTLCGQLAAGEAVPFLRYSDTVSALAGISEPLRPAPRDLYAEWGDGHVCQRCLLHHQALNAGCS